MSRPTPEGTNSTGHFNRHPIASHHLCFFLLENYHKKWKYLMYLDCLTSNNFLSRAPVLLDYSLAAEKLSTSIITTENVLDRGGASL